MVAAHDLGPLAEQATHHAPRFGEDHHRSERSRSGLMGGRPTVVGKMLDEVTAQVDIEQLHAPADGQHRHIRA